MKEQKDLIDYIDSHFIGLCYLLPVREKDHNNRSALLREKYQELWKAFDELKKTL